MQNALTTVSWLYQTSIWNSQFSVCINVCRCCFMKGFTNYMSHHFQSLLSDRALKLLPNPIVSNYVVVSWLLTEWPQTYVLDCVPWCYIPCRMTSWPVKFLGGYLNSTWGPWHRYRHFFISNSAYWYKCALSIRNQ